MGIIMYRIQELMKGQKMKDPNGNKVLLPPVIQRNSECPVPA